MEIIKKGEIQITLRDLTEAKEIFLDSVPRTSGVYFLFNKTKIIYIGQTKNLKRRIDGHLYIRLKNKKIEKFNRIYFIEADNDEERKNLERFNLKKYLNDGKGHYLTFEL